MRFVACSDARCEDPGRSSLISMSSTLTGSRRSRLDFRGGRTQRAVWRGCAVFLAAGLLAAYAGGCASRDQKSAEIKSLEGIADEIDLENNRVSMRVTDGKGGERVVEGTFREDTEVIINGRRQRLEDVRPGDHVLVFGFREGEGAEARLVATKVVVTRPTATDWKATGKAADAEAGSRPAAVSPSSGPAAAPSGGGATAPTE